MPTERSIAEVEELKTLFAEASVLISTDYRGMNVTAMNLMRRALRNGGIKYRISKNSLASIAADEMGRPEIKELIVGPVGWVYTDSDASAAAKSLVNHIEVERLDMVIHGALMGDQMLSREQVEALARLPGRDQLLAMLFAQMNAPVAGLATVLSGSIRGLATVLQRISELDGAREADADEPEAAADAGSDDAAPVAEPEAAAEDAGADEEAPAAEPEAAAEDACADGAPAVEEEAPAEEPSAEADEGTEDKSEGEAGADED
jgi:large subunit ribosomal protein L10